MDITRTPPFPPDIAKLPELQRRALDLALFPPCPGR
jgi:hypothetical protein